MMEKQEKYLIDMNWDPAKIVVVPGNQKAFLAKLVGLIGFASACVAITDPQGVESFGEGSFVSMIGWLKKNGVYQEYLDLMDGEEQPMDINFSGRLERARELSGNPIPEAPPVPDVPPVEAEPEVPPKVDQVPQQEERRFDRYVERVKYLTDEMDMHFDAHVDGYITRDKKYFVDGMAVKNFESETDKQYIDFVKVELSYEYTYPEIEATEEKKEELPDITQGLPQKETEKPVRKATAEEIAEREVWLKKNGFVKNPRTYRWVHKENDELFITHVEASSDVIRLWEQFLNKVVPRLSDMTIDVPVDDVETEEVDEISPEDLEAAADKHDELVIEGKKFTIVDMKKMPLYTGKGKISDLEAAAEKYDEVVADQDQGEEEEDRGGMGLVDAVADVRKREKEEEAAMDTVERLGFVGALKEIREEWGAFRGWGTDFFQKLYGFNFRTLSLNFTRLEKEGEVNITITPQPFEDDPAFKDMAPLNIKGNVADLDKNFFKHIERPLKVVEGIFSNSDEFLKEAKKAEAKTKAAKEKADATKKAQEDLEKYLKGDKQTDVTLKKKVAALLELDPKNKLGLEEQAKLDQGKLV